MDSQTIRMDFARVLLVDDEPAFLATAEAILAADFVVEAHHSPRRALAAFARSPFDVVCADLQMPEMNGVDLLERVRADSPTTGRLLLTGAPELAKREPGALRNYRVLVKPFEPQRLVDTVAHLARLARSRRVVTGVRAAVMDATRPGGERRGR